MRGDWPEASATLAAHDDPVDAVEWKLGQRAQQRFDAEEANTRVHSLKLASASRVLSPMASRSHCDTDARIFSVSRPAALRVSICSPTHRSANMPGAK